MAVTFQMFGVMLYTRPDTSSVAQCWCSLPWCPLKCSNRYLQVPHSHRCAPTRNNTSWCQKQSIRAQFHCSAYCRILRFNHEFSTYVQAPNFCASLGKCRMPAQKPKFAANVCNRLAVKHRILASVSANSVLMIFLTLCFSTGSCLRVMKAMCYTPVIFALLKVKQHVWNYCILETGQAF